MPQSTARPQAKNAQGQVIEFNGTGWVPVQSQPTASAMRPEQIPGLTNPTVQAEMDTRGTIEGGHEALLQQRMASAREQIGPLSKKLADEVTSFAIAEAGGPIISKVASATGKSVVNVAGRVLRSSQTGEIRPLVKAMPIANKIIDALAPSHPDTAMIKALEDARLSGSKRFPNPFVASPEPGTQTKAYADMARSRAESASQKLQKALSDKVRAEAKEALQIAKEQAKAESSIQEGLRKRSVSKQALKYTPGSSSNPASVRSGVKTGKQLIQEEMATRQSAGRVGSAGDPTQWTAEDLWAGYMKNRGTEMGQTIVKELQRRGLTRSPIGSIR